MPLVLLLLPLNFFLLSSLSTVHVMLRASAQLLQDLDAQDGLLTPTIEGKSLSSGTEMAQGAGKVEEPILPERGDNHD